MAPRSELDYRATLHCAMPNASARLARIIAAAFSAIMTTGTFVLPDTSVGMMPQSTTRRPVDADAREARDRRRLRGSSAGPIRVVPLGWKIVPPVFFANSSSVVVG